MEKEQRKARIYLVDDHPIIRKGFTQVINQESDLEVCGSADNAEDTLRDVINLKPDCVIVDVLLENASGIDIVKGLKRRFPGLCMMVLSMHDESIYAERALRAGARGYIMKKEASEKIVGAIRHVLSGKIYLSDEMSSRLLEKFTLPEQDMSDSAIDQLTDRELEVLEMIGQGVATKIIAEKLCISARTVEAHRAHIKEKLGITDGAALVRYAVQWIERQARL